MSALSTLRIPNFQHVSSVYWQSVKRNRAFILNLVEKLLTGIGTIS